MPHPLRAAFSITRLIILALAMITGSTTFAKTVKISILTEVPEVVKDIDVFKAIPAISTMALESRKEKLKRAGIDVVFDYHQNKMDPAELHDTMKKVYESDSIAAVGFRSSAGVEYASKVILGTDFVAVSPFATAAKVFEMKPNYFAVVAGNREVAHHLENFIVKDLKAKRPMSIVAWDSPYSRDFQESFSPAFQKKVKLIKTWESVMGFEKEIEGIRKYNPDVVILPNFPMASASLIRMLSNAGIKPVFVGADSWGEGENSVMPKILKNIDFISYTIRQFSLFNLTEKQKLFKEKLKMKYDTDYASVTGLYHDSIQFILDLILKNAGNPTRAAIAKSASRETVIEGVMGKNCLSSHSCSGRSFTILKLTNQGYSVQQVISP